MQSRYWLRFEGGDRRGERVAIPAGGLTVGRAEGAGLRLAVSSVSGRHAGLEVLPEGVLLRDLGSTNGTRVGGARVDERLLAHGDAVRFGDVELTFQDDDLAGGIELEDAAAAAAPAADPAALGGLERLDASRVAGASSKRPLILGGLAVLAVASFAISKLLGGDAGPVGSSVRPVASVPGNLLDGGAFEAEDALDGWVQDEDRPLALAAEYRVTGEQGLGGVLAPGEVLRLASPWVRVDEGAALTARASVRVERDVDVRMSVEFDTQKDGTMRIPGGGADSGDGEVELTATAIAVPGVRQGRLVLDVRASDAEDASGGELSLDDAALTLEAGAGAAIRHDEYSFEVQPDGSASLARIDRVLVPRIARGTGRLQATREEKGVRLATRGAAFEIDVSGDLAAEGFATLSENGLRARPVEFEAEDVTGILLGANPLLVQFDLGGPVKVRATKVDGGGAAQRVRITTSPLASDAFLQLEFTAERDRADDLANDARRALTAGEPAACLAAWTELLRDFPFDAELVAEATEVRSRVVAEGLDQVAKVREEFEQARFFDLPEIYRRNHAAATSLLERYGDSAVAADAEALLAEIDAALAAHVDAARVAARERLASVAEILNADGARELATHVSKNAEESD